MPTRHKLAIGLLAALGVLLAGAACLAALLRWPRLSPLLAYYVSLTSVRPQACVRSQQLAPGTYRLALAQEYERGFVILYTAVCRRSGAPDLLVEGYQVFEWQGLTWRRRGSGMGGYSTQSPPPSQPVRYGVASGTWSSGRGTAPGAFTLVSGSTTLPNAATAAAGFADGQVVSSPISGGFFAAIVPAQAAACDLRVLAADGSELARYDLGPVSRPIGGPGTPGGACPP